MQRPSDAEKDKERDGDYMVEFSKTMWAVHVRIASEMAKTRAALAAELPVWIGAGRVPVDSKHHWRRG